MPRLRQRVLPAPANLSPPMWVDDHNVQVGPVEGEVIIPAVPDNDVPFLDRKSVV